MLSVDKKGKKPIVIDVKCSEHSDSNTSCYLTQSDASLRDGGRCSPSQASSNLSQSGSGSVLSNELSDCGTTCTWSTSNSGGNHSSDQVSFIGTSTSKTNNAGCDYCKSSTCSQQDSTVFSSPPSSILIQTIEPIQDETLRKQTGCQTSAYDLNPNNIEDINTILCKLVDLNRKQSSTPCESKEQKKGIIDIKMPERKSRDTEKTRPCLNNIPLIREHHTQENKADTSNLSKCTVRIVDKQKDQAQLKTNEKIGAKQRDSPEDNQCKAIDVEVQTSCLFTKVEKPHSQNKMDHLSQIQNHKETSTCDNFKQIGDKKEEQIESCPREKLTLVDIKCGAVKSTQIDSDKEDKMKTTQTECNLVCIREKGINTCDNFEQIQDKKTPEKPVEKQDDFKKTAEDVQKKPVPEVNKTDKSTNTPLGLIDTSDESTQTRFKIDKEFEQKTTDKPVAKQDETKKPDADIKEDSGKKPDTKEHKQETPENPVAKEDDSWFSWKWLDWLLSKKPDSDITEEDLRKTPENMKPKQEKPTRPAVKLDDVKKKPVSDVKKTDGVKESVKEKDQKEKKPDSDITKEDLRKTPDSMEPKQETPPRPAVKQDDVKKTEEDVQKKPVPDLKKTDEVKESLKSVKEKDQKEKKPDTKEFEQKTTDEPVVKQNETKKPDADIKEDSGKKPDTKEHKQETPEKPVAKQKTPTGQAVKQDDVKKTAEDVQKKPVPDLKKTDGVKESLKSVKEKDQKEKKPEKPFEIPKDRSCEIRNEHNDPRKPENDTEKQFCKIFNANYSEDVDLKLTEQEIKQFNKQTEHIASTIENSENEKKTKKKPKEPTSAQYTKKHIREEEKTNPFLTTSELEIFLR